MCADKSAARLSGMAPACRGKPLLQQRDERIRDLPEYQAPQQALTAVIETRTRLKLAIRDDSEPDRLEVEIDEAKFHRRDLGEIVSHHLGGIPRRHRPRCGA